MAWAEAFSGLLHSYVFTLSWNGWNSRSMVVHGDMYSCLKTRMWFFRLCQLQKLYLEVLSGANCPPTQHLRHDQRTPVSEESWSQHLQAPLLGVSCSGEEWKNLKTLFPTLTKSSSSPLSSFFPLLGLWNCWRFFLVAPFNSEMAPMSALFHRTLDQCIVSQRKWNWRDSAFHQF